MQRRIFSVVMFILLLTSILTLAFNIQPVKASGTIFIRADGSIDPPTAPISTVDAITYTFTGNIIDDSIVIERDNIVVDGAGYTLQGTYGPWVYQYKGIDVAGKSNVTIKNTNIQHYFFGISLDHSSNNIISGNNITDIDFGIHLQWDSNYNSISGNNITANRQCGIYLWMSLSNIISGNNITANNAWGIGLSSSSSNSISGNDIANNGYGIVIAFPSNYNSIFGNNITANTYNGISLDSSNYNIISGNNITNNGYGIALSSYNGICVNNSIFHNNFINNAQQEYSSDSMNVWDDSYPSGGNYWSNYAGTDLYSGPYQNITGSDGIGDTPYIIDANNRDNYPLMQPYPRAAHVDWWPMFHHDLSHSGYSTSTGPTTNNTIWNDTIGWGVGSSPAVADGKVYVGSDHGNVYCLDALTGAQIWNFTTKGWYVDSSPAVADGKVYIGSDDGNIYCLDALTGAYIWSYATGSYVFSSPAVADDRVYVGSWLDWKVYCLDALTGAQIWNFTTGNWTYSSPAVADGKVYIGSLDKKVYCLDAFTGASIWNYTTGDEVWSSPAVADGKVYIGSFDGKVYCLDALTGASIWNYTTDHWVYSSPAVADGKVYAASDRVYCLDALTGAHIWSYTIVGGVGSSPAVADGKVYIGSPNDGVYAFGPSLHVHDVAVTNVASSKTAVGQGFSSSINVTVANQGDFTEAFNVTAFANATIIGSENVTLIAGNSTTVTFTWNTAGFAYGNYTLSAYAWPVPGETDTSNNQLVGGQVLVSIPGDIKVDGTVDIFDAIILAGAYNSKPGDPNWNPNAEINGDNIVDIYDAIILANHYNQRLP